MLPCFERGIAKRPSKKHGRRHATRNDRAARLRIPLLTLKLAISLKAKIRCRALPRRPARIFMQTRCHEAITVYQIPVACQENSSPSVYFLERKAGNLILGPRGPQSRRGVPQVGGLAQSVPQHRLKRHIHRRGSGQIGEIGRPEFIGQERAVVAKNAFRRAELFGCRNRERN